MQWYSLVLGWTQTSEFMFCYQSFLEKFPVFQLGSKIFSSRTQFMAKLQEQRLSDCFFTWSNKKKEITSFPVTLPIAEFLS